MDIIEIADITESTDCPICLCSPKNPVETHCSHRFCKKCLRRCIRSKPECPVCRAPLVDCDNPNCTVCTLTQPSRRQRRPRRETIVVHNVEVVNRRPDNKCIEILCSLIIVFTAGWILVSNLPSVIRRMS